MTDTYAPRHVDRPMPPNISRADKEALCEVLTDALARAGRNGITIAEFRNRIPEHHHGSISGILSDLHKHEEITRLAESRGGCEIYVDLAFVDGRETRVQGRGPSPLKIMLDYWMQPEDLSKTGTTTMPRARKFPAQFAREMERLYRQAGDTLR